MVKGIQKKGAMSNLKRNTHFQKFLSNSLSTDESKELSDMIKNGKIDHKLINEVKKILDFIYEADAHTLRSRIDFLVEYPEELSETERFQTIYALNRSDRFRAYFEKRKREIDLRNAIWEENKAEFNRIMEEEMELEQKESNERPQITTLPRIAAALITVIVASIIFLFSDNLLMSKAEQWATNQPLPALHVDFATNAGPNGDKSIAYYYNHKDYEKVGELLHSVIDTTTNQIRKEEYQFYLGTAMSRSGNLQKAIKILKSIAKSKTNLYRNDAKLELAYAYILTGHTTEAKRVFEQLTKDHTLLPYYQKRAIEGLQVLNSNNQ